MYENNCDSNIENEQTVKEMRLELKRCLSLRNDIDIDVKYMDFINFNPNNDISILGKNLYELLNKKDTCDFNIIKNGNIYPCHRLIISARSPVLDTMMKHNFFESVNSCLDFIHFDEWLITPFLKYLYMGTVDDDLFIEKDYIKLLDLSNYYNLPHMKNICEYKISTLLCCENVFEILCNAKLFEAEILYKNCIKYCIINRKQFIFHKNWPHICENIDSDIQKDLMRNLFTVSYY